MKTELIKEISGTDTKPFKRFSYKIDIDELIHLLIKSKTECEHKGYKNLKVWISEDSGLIDMSIHGDREFNEEEKDMIERVQVIGRIKDKTSKGLTREDLLK
jgi:hypothetical protein